MATASESDFFLSDVVVYWRKKANLSLTDLARLMGRTSAAAWRLENSKQLGLEAASQVARVLNLSVEQFILEGTKGAAEMRARGELARIGNRLPGARRGPRLRYPRPRCAACGQLAKRVVRRPAKADAQ